MASFKKLKKVRTRRVRRVRSRIVGTQGKPRLSVSRSARSISVQAVADDIGRTIASASTLSKELRGKLAGMKKKDQAKEVGKLLAERLRMLNVRTAVFDRGRFLYHGRVKALADAVRESGITL